jgi:surface antigen/LysM repeat protein
VRAQLANKTKTYSFIAQFYAKKFFSALQRRFPEIASFYRHRFPGVSLRHKLDNWDYALNFSSEILVGILVISVALINIGVFKFSAAKEFTYTDNSLAAKLLKYHPDSNLALYAKENTVKTTISQDGLISHAYADTTLSTLAALDEANDSGATNEDATFSNNIMVKPNPDSVQDLVSKQVVIYETKGGDTLSSIARKFDVSVNTIAWANNLPSQTIKPGWFLKILPINGVLYQVDSNDTLPDIAGYFKGNMETIISYNGLSNAEDIEEGQWIIIPDGSVPPPPTPTATAAPKATRTQAGTPVIVHSGGGHSFPKGYCTWYVASKRKITFGGNANAWLKNGKAAGYATGSAPAVGAVVVTNESRVGHVAYVEEVKGDKFRVSEMNYKGFGVRSERWIPIGSGAVRGFIY